MTRVMPIVAALVWMMAGVAAAGDFDGSKLLLYAPVEAMDCGPGEGCAKERPEDIGAPNFLRIDFANKVIVGPKQTTPILVMDKGDDQILLQGKELGYAWTLVLAQDSGTMTVTLGEPRGGVRLIRVVHAAVTRTEGRGSITAREAGDACAVGLVPHGARRCRDHGQACGHGQTTGGHPVVPTRPLRRIDRYNLEKATALPV